MNWRNIVIGIITVLMVISPVFGIPVIADDETSVEAEVEVLPVSNISYGVKVIESPNTFFPYWSLGEPDDWGSLIFRNGWLSIELEDTIRDTETISIWAANSGWQSSKIRIYVSSDGHKWKPVGVERVAAHEFTKYEFPGSFGEVRYIRINRSGSHWSFIFLDSVCAKGGDTGKEESNGQKGKRETHEKYSGGKR